MFVKLSCFVCIAFLLASCTTDDINPTLIEFKSSALTLSENGGSITISAKLNATATKQIIIPLTLTGTAILDSDYAVSSSQLVIEKGASQAEVVLTGINDSNTESIETVTITIENSSSFIQIGSYQISIEVLDDDTDSDNDGVPDSDDNCPTVAGEIANNGCPYLGFLINEVHYDPEATLLGDANGDGTREANEDEFIEFYNSGIALDISGYKIFDATALANNTPRHVFLAGTVVPANGVIVVFGGGNPTGNFGGAIVQTATGGQMNISNSGDLITVQDATGTVVLVFDSATLSANPDESYTRNPDLSGDFVQHSTIIESNGALFSPGKKIDGSSF